MSTSTVAAAGSAAPVRRKFVERADEFDELMTAVMPKLRKYTLENGTPSTTKVMGDATPDELASLFQLQSSDQKEGSSIQAILDDIDNVLEHSVRTQHPRFYKQLYAGSEPVGQVSELVTSVVNTASHIYAVSPVLSMMEVQLRQRIIDILGWDPKLSDGAMMNGGTMSLMTAMMTARHWKFPHIRKEGMRPTDRLVAFTSAQAHYGVGRAAMVGGMGMDNCISVAADENGCMVPAALKAAVDKAVADGFTPFFVSATAGTTVMGGYDPLVALRGVCDEFDMWLHVDGAWGGSVIFSEHEHRRALVKGLDTVDSFNINFHKAMGLPQVCSFLLTNSHKGALEQANSSGASYLFQGGDDLGDKTLQCGRRADSLKLWLFWKRYGIKGMSEIVDTAFDNAIYMTERIHAQPSKFIMAHQPMSANVCFWYVPPAFRAGGSCELVLENKEDVLKNFDVIDKIQRLVRDRAQSERNIFLQANPLHDLKYPNFFRQVFIQTTVEKEDVDFILDELDRVGSDITLDDLNDL